MKVLVKTEFFESVAKQTILNVFYNNPDDTCDSNVDTHLDNYIDKWINEYIELEIKSLNLKPLPENIVECSYDIECRNDEYTLTSKTKKLNKGYLYNTGVFEYQTLFNIKVNDFNNDSVAVSNVSNNVQEKSCYTKLFIDINVEINKRIIKELKPETLILLQNEYNDKIQTKKNWTQNELILLQNTIIRKHEIELYNKISRQLKKNNKKQNRKSKSKSPQNNIDTNTETLLKNQVLNSCKLEYLLVKKL